MNSELDIDQAKNIKVAKEEKIEIDKLVTRTNQYPEKMKLLCFPYCPMMNVLTNRSSPSYYNFFYPEAFLPENQQEVINNLKLNDTVIVLQKKGKIEPEALYEDVRFGKLKNYILKNYKMDFETENFAIYTKR